MLLKPDRFADLSLDCCLDAFADILMLAELSRASIQWEVALTSPEVWSLRTNDPKINIHPLCYSGSAPARVCFAEGPEDLTPKTANPKP